MTRTRDGRHLYDIAAAEPGKFLQFLYFAIANTLFESLHF